MKLRIALIVFVFVVSSSVIGYSEEIYLKNNDRVTGTIISETDEDIVLDTEAMGEVTIEKGKISSIGGKEKKKSSLKQTVKKKEKKRKYPWKKTLSVGYNAERGNAKSQELNIDMSLKRNRKHIDEFIFRSKINYSSSDNKMDDQKWYVLGRYAYSFGKAKKWYNFYKTEVDHDKFSEIDYRIVPSTGLGYWFSDTERWKILAECGVGYKYEEFTDNTETKKEVVIGHRLFFKKKLFEDLSVSEDFVFYNSVSDLAEYRFRSETAIVNPINELWSTRLSFIWNYDNSPAGDTEKTDLETTLSLEYSF